MTRSWHRKLAKRSMTSSMMLVILVVLQIGIGLTTPSKQSLASEVNDASHIDLSAYDGHWQRIEDSDADADRLSAIDVAISGLSWIMKKMASGVLKKTTTPPPEMKFVWDGERLFQGIDVESGEFSRPVDLDGKTYYGEDHRGVAFASSWALAGSGLRVNWEQAQATGSNLYRIDDRDHTLVVEHTINVTAISDITPIVFRSRFSRTDLARSGSIPADMTDQLISD